MSLIITRYVRARVGARLLKPFLVAELENAITKNKQQTDPALERYWMGRQTAYRRTLDAGLYEDY